MISRRMFLVTGGASAVILGSGSVWMAHHPGLKAARAPWRQAEQGFGDPRLDALAYAILAPNPHNRQPWMFELAGADRIDIYCDLERRLEQTDPFDRQITIGFGCMLELLRMAAAEAGYVTQFERFPDGAAYPRLDGGRVASVTFNASTDAGRDPLFEDVLQRRSTKEPFDMDRPVSADALADLLGRAGGTLETGGTHDPEQVARLIELTWAGWQIEQETPATRRESIDLMRIGNREVSRHPDGIDLGGTAMGLMKMAGLVGRKALDTPGSQAYRAGVDMYREMIYSAQGFVWVKAGENTRQSQLQAGQTWVRMNLAAQHLGLAIHPLSQVLQEFPEMAGPYREIHHELGAGEGGVVHMLGRIGYSKHPGPSPRWPLESKLISKQA